MFSFIKEAYQSLDKSEKKFVFFWIALVLLFTLIPTFYALSLNNENYHYTGFNSISGGDLMVYFSQMEEAIQGRVIFHNLYTSESSPGYFFSPIWLFLGWLVKLTGLAKLLIFHVFRIFIGALFLYLIYLFISKVFKETLWRKVCFIIVSLGAGFGIFTFGHTPIYENILKYWGTDLWVSESNTFLTLFHSPLFILSQIFILVFFWWVIERLSSANFKETLVVSLAILFLGFFHPYDLVTLYVISGFWWLFSSLRAKKFLIREFFKLLLIYLISFLAISYYLWLKNVDLAFALWSKQNITVSPIIYNYISGYGLAFIFYLVGVYPASKSRQSYWQFLVLWSIASLLLLYFPLQIQRRFSNGLHLPLAMIATYGLSLLIVYWKNKGIWQKINRSHLKSGLVYSLAVILLTLTTVFNLCENIYVYSAYRKSLPFYLTNNERAAFNWVKENVAANQVTLTSLGYLGNVLPAFTGRIVYYGHSHQTGNFEDKKEKLKWLFKSKIIDPERFQWLKEQRIDFLFYRLADQLTPADSPYLELIYQNSEIKIYRVRD